MRIILASQSPRRRELLTLAGLDFTVISSGFEENSLENDPAKRTMTLAEGKALSGYREVTAGENEPAGGAQDPAVVIGADTMVACAGKILGKPKSREEAEAMIRLLQGRVHEVYTGVSLVWGDGDKPRKKTFFERTDVEVYPMTEAQIVRYVDTGEPFDKAGGYGIQGPFAIWVRGIRGDYCNVVGLPIARLTWEMRAAGLIG
jgi:septum formation protein